MTRESSASPGLTEAFTDLVWDAPPADSGFDRVSLDTALGPDAPQPLKLALPILIRTGADGAWPPEAVAEAAALVGAGAVREWPPSPPGPDEADPVRGSRLSELAVVTVPRRGGPLAPWAQAVARTGETLRRADPERPLAVTLGADADVLQELEAVSPLEPDIVRLSWTMALDNAFCLWALRQVHRRRRLTARRLSLVADCPTLDPDKIAGLVALGADAVLVGDAELGPCPRSRPPGATALDTAAEAAAALLAEAGEGLRQILARVGGSEPDDLRLGHLAATRADLAADLGLRITGWYPAEYSVARQAETLKASYRQLEGVLRQTAVLLGV